MFGSELSNPNIIALQLYNRDYPHANGRRKQEKQKPKPKSLVTFSPRLL